MRARIARFTRNPHLPIEFAAMLATIGGITAAFWHAAL